MKQGKFDSEGSEGVVSEVQGVDGPFSFPEKLFQRLWAQREFNPRGARTADGRDLEVLHPGRWNRLGGPDFREARLRVGGEEIVGDVELHLRAKDWAAHGHADDLAYSSVVLHVVLFPCVEKFTHGPSGQLIPILTLLPRLYRGLEEYACEAALEALANRPMRRLLEELGQMPPSQRRAQLAFQAKERWVQKVRFAELRIARTGWVEACHLTALEILGYRFNRSPMVRLASRYPLIDWGSGRIEVEDLWREESSRWSRQGIRPANGPRVRLGQYAAWCRIVPDWPDRLRDERVESGHGVGDALFPAVAFAPARLRRHWGMRVCRDRWSREICGEALGGSRRETMFCDGFLPLLAAAHRDQALHWGARWALWYPGDMPAVIGPALREVSLLEGPGVRASHGLAQGLLGWLLQQERRV